MRFKIRYVDDNTRIMIKSTSFKIHLKQIGMDDLDGIQRCANSPDIGYNFGCIESFPYPYQRHDALALIEAAAILAKNESAYHFGIRNNLDNKLVGMFTIHEINKKNRNCEIGYWIDVEHRGKGYSYQAIELGLNECFKQMHMKKVYAKILDFNKPSIHIMDKLGFVQEGILKNHQYMERNGIGFFAAQHIYAISDHDYNNKHSARITHT